MKISGFMSRNGKSALADDSPTWGKRLLEQHRTKHFPVMDEQSFLVGVRSDRDVATDFGL